MNKYQAGFFAVTASFYCALALSEEQSIVEQCASHTRLAKSSETQFEGYNKVFLAYVPSTPEPRLKKSPMDNIVSCLKNNIESSQLDILRSEMSPSDKAFLAQYAARTDETSQAEYNRYQAIDTQVLKAARERTDKLFNDRYSVEVSEDLIIDKSNKTHFIVEVPKPMTQEEVCSNLVKDSIDWKWCMNLIPSSPDPLSECKNSYGDKCGTKY